MYGHKRHTYPRYAAENALVLRRTVYYYTMIVKVNDVNIKGMTVELPTGSLADVRFDYEEVIRGGSRVFGDVIDGEDVFTTLILTTGI